MAAYAALHSLKCTIQSLLSSFPIYVDSSTEEILDSALTHAYSLARTLERCREVEADLEEGIIMEAARKLEDAIEFPISTHFLHQSQIGETFSFNLDYLRQDVGCFVQTAKKTAYTIETSWDQKVAKMIEENMMELFVQREEEEEEEDISAATDMVGLSDQFLMIKDKLASTLTEAPAWTINEIFGWISGMAGIGKTTLAIRIFHDPWVKEKFKYRAFVRVGREYRLKQVLQSTAAQLDLQNERMIMEADGSENLYGSFRRILMVRKCLIVLDDVWEDGFEFVFHLVGDKEVTGSRILVTSRTDVFIPYLNFKMRFMNEEESWELLRRKVFGEEECPKELVKVGKKIAKKCEGLPLLINAVAPILLSKAQKNLECWSRVAEKPSLVLDDATLQISQVLLSSYHEIHEAHKLCFLYITAFPQKCIVRRSTIKTLWRVEGFTHAWEIHKDDSFPFLIRKNLAIEHHKSWHSFKVKACRLHYTYWYLSKREAENNKFMYIINSYAHGLDERVKSHRRLAFYNNVLLAIKEVYSVVASISTVRSLLCTGPYHEYQVPICLEWKLLRVLNALTIRFYEFPIEVVKLIRLRYLALTCNGNLPPSIYKLWGLQYLIVHQHSSIVRAGVESYVPDVIWDLQELIHLQIIGRNLPDPPPGKKLSKLRKLLGVGVQSCTRGVLESIPLLKKLRIQIHLGPDAAQTSRCVDHISYLKLPKSFQCIVMNPALLSPCPIFSIPAYSTLKKLSLSGFGFPWKDMRKIAHLTNLEVLKLSCYAFQGEKWEANEYRFPGLRHLFIEDTDLVQWTCNRRGNFPSIRRLIMRNCHKLREIPQISNLDAIALLDCNPLVETCAKKKHPEPDQVDYWLRDINNGKRVNANYSWK